MFETSLGPNLQLNYFLHFLESFGINNKNNNIYHTHSLFNKFITYSIWIMLIICQFWCILTLWCMNPDGLLENPQMLYMLGCLFLTVFINGGFIGPSACGVCLQAEETLDHIFLECPFARFLWNSLASAFCLNLDFSAGFNHFVLQALKCNISSQLLAIWRTAFISCTWLIWHTPNKHIFEDVKPWPDRRVAFLWSTIQESEPLIAGIMDNLQQDLLWLHSFGMVGKVWKTPRVIYRYHGDFHLQKEGGGGGGGGRDGSIAPVPF